MASLQQSRQQQTRTQSDNDNLPLILIHSLPKPVLPVNQWLQSRFRLLDPSATAFDPSFPAKAQSVRALVCVGSTPVDSETFEQFPSVECVVGSMAGIDHIDLVECRRRGIRVTNAGEAFSDDVADIAVALFIDVLRMISAADRYIRAGTWTVMWQYPLGSMLGGKRVGIVGLGSISPRVAKRLEAFGCIIAYHSRKQKSDVPFPYYADVDDLATNSDALVLRCALTNETYHMINKDVMKALGRSGVVINVGRGGLINEKELVRCLEQGEIGGAGLDVYENEPNVPKELFALDNVVLSPHKAGGTPESFAAVGEVVIGNLESFFANKPLLSEV